MCTKETHGIFFYGREQKEQSVLMGQKEGERTEEDWTTERKIDKNAYSKLFRRIVAAKFKMHTKQIYEENE